MASLKKKIGATGRRILPRAFYHACCRAYDHAEAALGLPFCIGFGRQCPFCGLRLRRFLPDPGEPSVLFERIRVIGGGPSDQAICPLCCSFERERHVYLYLKHMTPIFRQPVRLLHIAPERKLGRLLSRQKNIRYTTGDLNPTRAELRVDLTAMEFADESFDAVICNHVLEHIADDRAAMAEILRVLRPGGWAILQVPIAPYIDTRENPDITDAQERLRLFGQHDHVRIYGQDYGSRLESVGFRMHSTSIARERGELFAKRYGLLADELIYIAGRPVAAGKRPSGSARILESLVGHQLAVAGRL